MTILVSCKQGEVKPAYPKGVSFTISENSIETPFYANKGVVISHGEYQTLTIDQGEIGKNHIELSVPFNISTGEYIISGENEICSLTWISEDGEKYVSTNNSRRLSINYLTSKTMDQPGVKLLTALKASFHVILTNSKTGEQLELKQGTINY